jgi:hypothetical protein
VLAEEPAGRVAVTVGEPVDLTSTAAVPPGSGLIVRVDWDFESTGTYPERSTLETPDRHVVSQVTPTFTEPGVHFPVLRVTAERNGDPGAVFGLVQNLARARVIVTS